VAESAAISPGEFVRIALTGATGGVGIAFALAARRAATR